MQIKVKAITCGNIFINQAGADIGARNASVLGKLVQNRFGRVYRDGKTNAFNAAYRYFGGVNAYNLAVGINKRTAGVAGVNGGISLNKVKLAVTQFDRAV